MENIYVQLYSFGGDCNLTMEKKLQKTAEIGYAGVEFAGYGDLSAENMKKLLDKFNLKAVSSHVSMNAIVENLPYMAELGAKMIVVPGYPFTTKAEAIKCAKLLNENGKKSAEYGIRIGYHNHTAEFKVDEGKYLLDYVIENTDPEYVSFQLDCGWASAAGQEPVEYINKYAGRFMSVHIKENGKLVIPETGKELLNENVPTGKGYIDWKAVKAAADAQGCKAYIVEREWSYNVPASRVQCLKEDFEYLKNNI